MQTKKNYHHPNLRQQLLDGALDLLRKEGIKQLTIRKLAKLVGVSHAAPYRHFANKQALVAELLYNAHSILTQMLQAAVDSAPGTASNRLCALNAAYLDFALQYPEHLVLMFSNEGLRAYEEQSRQRDTPPADSFAVLEHAVRACQREGSLDRQLAADALALALWSQIHGLALLRREGLIERMAGSRGVAEPVAVAAILDMFEKLQQGISG